MALGSKDEAAHAASWTGHTDRDARESNDMPLELENVSCQPPQTIPKAPYSLAYAANDTCAGIVEERCNGSERPSKNQKRDVEGLSTHSKLSRQLLQLRDFLPKGRDDRAANSSWSSEKTHLYQVQSISNTIYTITILIDIRSLPFIGA